MDFLNNQSSTAQWHALVCEAEQKAGYQYDESLENYLVITLEQFMTDNELANFVIALEFLSSIKVHGKQSGEKLRIVGDQCLLLSGLFPERIMKKNVSLDYVIGVGQNAYSQLSHSQPKLHFDIDLFSRLSTNFVGLMDVLNAMRSLYTQSV